MSAPSAIIEAARPAMLSASAARDPSQKLSGVTLIMPIIMGRSTRRRLPRMFRVKGFMARWRLVAEKNQFEIRRYTAVVLFLQKGAHAVAAVWKESQPDAR